MNRVITKDLYVTQDMLDTCKFDLIEEERQELEDRYWPQETRLNVHLVEELSEATDEKDS